MKLKLKELREAAGYRSARAYAQHLGVVVQTYTNYESGRRDLPLDLACDICEDLGCTLDELAGREEYISEPSALWRAYKRLNAEGQASLDSQIKMHLENPLFQEERPDRGVRVSGDAS